MTDTPKNVPPEVIEALKRGDKQAAMKMLLAGGKVSGIKDVMQLLKSLQESGVLRDVKQHVKVNMTSRPAAGREPMVTPTTAPSAAQPHSKPVTPVPLSSGGLSPGEVPRTGGKSIAFVVLLAVAAAAIWLILR